MYCRNCGADEPEIKINDKTYCSSCGLPLDAEISKTSEVEDSSKESVTELSHAFSKLGNAIKTEDVGGSYRSKDIKINPKSIDSIRTIPRPVQEATQKELSDQEQTPTKTREVTLENEVITPKEENLEPISENLLPDVNLKEDQARENESVQEEIIPEPVSAESPVFNPPTPKPTTDINELAAEVEDLAKQSLSQEKNDLITSLEEKSEEKNDLEVPGETEKKDISLNPKVEVLTKDSNEDSKIDSKEPQLEKAVKKVDELGAASRLIDILEDEVQKEDIEEKKEKNRSLGKSFSKLIDILNQPVSSPQPVKHPTKKKIPDPISATLESLDSTKEIESPLARPEIEESMENHESETDSNDIPASIPDTKIPEPKEKKISKRKMKKANKFERTDSEKDWPIFTDETQKTSDIKIDEKNAQEPVDRELENIENKMKEKFSQEEEIEEKPKLTKKELEEIQQEIHALGDKKGHVDHWPEEEVAHFDVLDSKEQSHLTGFFKSVYENKDKPKEELKKENPKKKKINNPKKNHLNIVLLFVFLIVILGSAVMYLTFNEKNPALPEEKIEQTLPFEPKIPSYIPAQYEMLKPQSSVNDTITITFRHLANSENTVTLQEQTYTGTESDFKEYAEGKSKEFLIENTSGVSYYILDEREIVWLNGEKKYTLLKNGDLDIEDLRRMAESLE